VTVKLTFLGVGDVCNDVEEHGRGGFCAAERGGKGRARGQPEHDPLCDGGMLSPSLQSGFDGGQNTTGFTNLEPFDLAVAGNHAFDFGPASFTEQMAASKYPWAAMNIVQEDGSPIPALGGVLIKKVGGLKVALILVGQDTSPSVSGTESLKYLPTVETGVAAAIWAHEDGADIVVGVVQTNSETDRKLMASLMANDGMACVKKDGHGGPGGHGAYHHSGPIAHRKLHQARARGQ